jgi:hypothetical protein
MAWRNEPIVLRRAVPFMRLLKGVDLVSCSGSSMLREAAYLGLPAYGIFKSRIGGVNRYLESMGRVRLIQSPEALPAIKLTKASPLAPVRSNPHLLMSWSTSCSPALRAANTSAALARTPAGYGRRLRPTAVWNGCGARVAFDHDVLRAASSARAFSSGTQITFA